MIFRITIAVLFMSFLPVISCNRTPDTETIRSYVRASETYSQGRFLDVINILQSENKFPPALMLRAKAEYFSGDITKAEKSLRRVIKIRPSKLEAHFYLARIQKEKGDLAAAIKTVEAILADNPQDIRTLRLAADLALETNRFDDAVILLDRAAEYSVESAMVLLDRARLRWISGGDVMVLAALDDLSRAKAMLPWDTPLLRSIINLENTIIGFQRGGITN
jgi:tetratricopeptide (TPR) repeat protein